MSSHNLLHWIWSITISFCQYLGWYSSESYNLARYFIQFVECFLLSIFGMLNPLNWISVAHIIRVCLAIDISFFLLLCSTISWFHNGNPLWSNCNHVCSISNLPYKKSWKICVWVFQLAPNTLLACINKYPFLRCYIASLWIFALLQSQNSKNIDIVSFYRLW